MPHGSMGEMSGWLNSGLVDVNLFSDLGPRPTPELLPATREPHVTSVRGAGEELMETSRSPKRGAEKGSWTQRSRLHQSRAWALSVGLQAWQSLAEPGIAAQQQGRLIREHAAGVLSFARTVSKCSRSRTSTWTKKKVQRGLK